MPLSKVLILLFVLDFKNRLDVLSLPVLAVGGMEMGIYYLPSLSIYFQS